MTRVQIMFVDDEPNVLAGLRRQLRATRDEWDIRTADSGEAALLALAVEPADVLVTDMRMPGMDGAGLLARVRELYPQTARFVLSGYAEDETVLKTTTLAHRYLSKPCDPEVLRDAVARAVTLRRVLRDGSVRAVTARLGSLPTPPALYTEIMRRLEDDRYGAEQIAEVVRRDTGVTAKLMQIVNSSFFGLSRRIVDAGDAVRILGLDLVRALVLFAGVMPKVDDTDGALSACGQHALRVGVLARRVLEVLGGDPKDTPAAFTAGVLHDVGTLVMMSQLRPLYDGVIRQAREQSRPMHEVEREVLGCDHAELGAHLLGLWGLPDEIVEAVLWHHAPSAALAAGTVQRAGPTLAVHVADVVDRTERPTGDHPIAPALDRAALDTLGLVARLDEWWQPERPKRGSTTTGPAPDAAPATDADNRSAA